MPQADAWRHIVASSLDWDQAHITLDAALAGLAADGRAERPAGQAHSVWQLLHHMQLAQHDLLEFCRNPDYTHDLTWPDDYWPKDAAPKDDAEWHASLARLVADRQELAQLAIDGIPDLAATIPWGTGQTYLRTILVAMDHAAYHLGQIVTVRRLNGDWPDA